MRWPSCIVFHVPHASKSIPPAVKPSYWIDDFALERELNRLTDHWIDELLIPNVPDERVVRAGVSRFVVDVERYANDADEAMAKQGMGAVYVRTTDGRPLRAEPDAAERERLLAQHYHPHHARLEKAVDRTVRGLGRVLILDLHSFPAEPLPCDQDERRPRPDVCLGSDPHHTPAPLITSLREAFESAGFSVGVNWPYAGTIVPLGRYGKDDRVQSVMIEINRRLYMDEETTERRRDFEKVGRELRHLIHEAVEFWARGGAS